MSSKSSNTDSNGDKMPLVLSPPVKFNVGGTIYLVSRSLLDRHPNTMLTRMASEEWAGQQRNSSSSIIEEDDPCLFIERNGFRFQYVLDFMRDGCVLLPVKTISKDAVLMELEYYGFVDVSPESIQISSIAVESVEYLFSLDENHKLAQKEHDRQRSDLKEQHEARMEDLRRKVEAEKEAYQRQSAQLEHEQACTELAYHLFSRFKQDGRLEWVIYNGSAELYKWASAIHAATADNKQPFDEALGKFGLKYVQSWFMNSYPQPPVRIKIAKL